MCGNVRFFLLKKSNNIIYSFDNEDLNTPLVQLF